MTDDNKQEAAELAKRAGRQSKHAAKNATRAATTVVEPAVNGAGEAVEDVVESVMDTTKRIRPKVLGRISNDAGVGFLALSVTLYAGIIAVNKFRSAVAGREDVIS